MEFKQTIWSLCWRSYSAAPVAWKLLSMHRLLSLAAEDRFRTRCLFHMPISYRSETSKVGSQNRFGFWMFSKAIVLECFGR